MFSRDNREDDLFRNSTFDTSQPDKIIIRENTKPAKKVRKRVKKNAEDEKAKKKALKNADKVKVISKKSAALAYSENISSADKKGSRNTTKTEEDKGFKIPRLSDIEKKRDDYDYSFNESDFRKSSADWRDSKIPDFAALSEEGLDPFSPKDSEKETGASVLMWIAIALAVCIFVSGIMTTTVYAKLQCAEKRTAAMSKLSLSESETAAQIAESVEDVESPLSYEEPKTQESRVLSLVLSSVEKDLKIKLVDEEDILVKNLPWSVTVTDSEGKATEESDEDQDGIIHMTEIPAGDYSVELNSNPQLAEYQIPLVAQTVSVKAKVEYKVITNIKEEIKSEKEINAAVEDNGNKAADVEVASPASNDTVEWVESTKTATGDEYIEAVPDLSKTASIKKDNFFVALLNSIQKTATSAFGRRTVAYPLLLSKDSDNSNVDVNLQTEDPSDPAVTTEPVDDEPVSTPTPTPTPEDAHSHSYKYQSNSDGTHTARCDGCGETVFGESCDTNGDGGVCSKCGYKSAKPTPTPTPTPTEAPLEDTNKASHNFVYTANNDGTHTRKCTDSNCPGGYETKETCTLNGDTCKYCKGKHTHSYTYTSNNDGTHKATCACGVTIKSEGCTFTDDVCTKCKYKRDSKYADNAQLYDSSKNALYLREGDSYRLAKYIDYKNDSSRKFYRKQDGFKYTGWQTLDGNTYYYTKDNVPVTGDQIIGGVKYHFATDGALSQGSGKLGIDVSKYQPSINWSSVKASGINYVIIRCGYRGSSTGVLVEDPYFKSHIKGAKSAGLKVGIYFFTTAISEAEAVEEASMVAYLCSGYGIDYPVFIDCESSGRAGYNSMSASQRTAIIKAFCNTVRSAGYTPGVYANKTWLTEKMNAGELSGYKIWLAQYNSAGPTYSGRYDLWQYTSKGSVNGISGYVDMNQSYLGY